MPGQAGLRTGSDRDRAGSAWPPSPSRWRRYRRRARRPARPCNRTAAAPARRQSRDRRRGASARPRRRAAAAPVPTMQRSSGRPAVAIGAHHALALLQRERGRLAGGAEHVEAVAAVVEQIARELGGAGAIRLAVRRRPAVATAAITPRRLCLLMALSDRSSVSRRSPVRLETLALSSVFCHAAGTASSGGARRRRSA